MKSEKILSVVIIIVCLALTSSSNQYDPIYKNDKYSIEERTKDLLSRMTVEEKVAQTIAIWRKMGAEGKFSPSGQAFDPQYGLGAIHRRYTDISISEGAEESNAIQKYFIENTRLGIPVLINSEGLHGIMANEATVFPQAIALASTWDTALFTGVYTIVARQARALGIHQVFSPNLDIIREPRYGRVQENYSEDPYLATKLGIACINGFQGSSQLIDSFHVAATAKHLAVSSQPEGGINKTPGNLSESIIREVFFPTFKAAVKQCNSRFFMISYNEINGIPSHINHWLLQDVLRREWNYKGITISDHNALNNLYKIHFVTENAAASAQKSIIAGVDMDLASDSLCFLNLVNLIKHNKVDIKVLDQAVERILRLKFEMGLFDHPYVDPGNAKNILNTEEDKAVALRAAREAVILLKNENNILPLDKNKIRSLAVIGPNAEHCMFGDYSGKSSTGVSVLEGMIRKVGKEKVRFAQGCYITRNAEDNPISDKDLSDSTKKHISEAVELTKISDLAIIVLGDNVLITGEHRDINDLNLTKPQDALAKAVIGAGKPVIVILLNGRPLSINYIAENADAILEGWYLGQSGGDALADIIFGDVNPSGKLTLTIPKYVGDLPCYYNKKPSSTVEKYVFTNNEPLYPFGFGLSYTKFEYKNLRAEPVAISKSGDIKVSVEVANTGKFKGDEIVQLYIRDMVSSVARPIKELKGFKRISLSPGETKVVEFAVGPEELSFYNEKMEFVVEPGSFDIMVGPASTMLSTVKIQVLD